MSKATNYLKNKYNYPKQEILVLGSGSLTEELLYGLKTFNENYYLSITVISNDRNSLLNIQNKYSIKTKFVNIIKDKAVLIKLIKDSTLVISLIPDDFQYIIALYCLENNRNLLSTSYISDEIMNLNTEVKKKGLLFLFECGCSPGLDHIIASKVINEAKRRSANIVHYENWAGAIPSPESMDNPFLLKLTNSSLESIKSMISDSTQLIKNKTKKIKESDLLENLKSNDHFHPSYNFEGYFTRNALRYKSFYNLKHAETVLCGSIRYKGFSFIIQAFKNIKLLSTELVDSKFKTWREFLSVQITEPRNESSLYNISETYVPKHFRFESFNPNLKNELERFFYYRLTLYALSFFKRNFISQHGFENLFNSLYSALVFFKFYDEDNLISPGVTVFKAFSILLENSIQMKEWERDLVYLKNVFRIRSFSGRDMEKSYDLIMYGKILNDSTATAYLVGRTCSIAAHCIISKKHNNLTGVTVPFDEVIADEVLKEFLKSNINIIEKTTLITKF